MFSLSPVPHGYLPLLTTLALRLYIPHPRFSIAWPANSRELALLTAIENSGGFQVQALKKRIFQSRLSIEKNINASKCVHKSRTFYFELGDPRPCNVSLAWIAQV